MAQLKFYKLGAEAMASKNPALGSIWFNTTNKTIEVKGSNGWEAFAGSLKDAVWNTTAQELTISKYDGSEIKLDFSQVADLNSVKTALTNLENKLVGDADDASKVTIRGAKAAAAAAQAKAEEGVSAASAAQGTADEALEKANANATAISTEAADRAAADTKIINGVGLAQDGTHVTTTGNYTKNATSVVEEIAALDTALKSLSDNVSGVVGGNIENINKDITDLKAATAGHTTDIKNINDGIAAMDFSKEVSTGNVRGKLVQVDGAITEFELSGNDIASAAELAQYKTDNNAALAGVKATAEAAATKEEFNAYKESNDEEVARVADLVDTFFKDALSDTDVQQYKDTLKELQDYISSDETAASTMAANIQANADAIGVKKAEGVEATGLFKYVDDKESAINSNVEGLADRINALETDGSLAALESRVGTAEADIDALQAAAAGYSGDNTIAAAIAVVAGAASAADDKAVAAQNTADAKIASVEGDTYVTATTDANKAVKLAVNVSAPAADATGLAKAKDLYDAFTWVEFA